MGKNVVQMLVGKVLKIDSAMQRRRCQSVSLNGQKDFFIVVIFGCEMFSYDYNFSC